MSKKKWHSKAIHLLVVLAMTVAMLIGSALPVAGHDSITIDVNEDGDFTEGFADPPLEINVNMQVENAISDEIDYYFTWRYKQNMGDVYEDLTPENFPLLFTDEIDRDVLDEDDDITETWMLNVPGWYEVEVVVWDDGDDRNTTAQVRVLGIIPEDIAFDVKGGQQEICVKGLLVDKDYECGPLGCPPRGEPYFAYPIEWRLVSGVELEPADIVVKVPPGIKLKNGEPFNTPGLPEDPSTWDKVGWTEEYEGTGLTGQDITRGFPCIHIEAMARGDIHIYATVKDDPLGGPGEEPPFEDIELHTEKKWGELHHSVLDLDAETAGIQGPTEYIVIPPIVGEDWQEGWHYETIEDTVYATFYEVVDPMRVGHAIVHWWLLEDDDLETLLDEAIDDEDEEMQEILEDLIDEGFTNTQELIDELMDHIAAQQGALDDNHWAAHGKYNTEWITDWMESLGYSGPGDREPFDAIDFLAKDIDDGGLGLHSDPDTFAWDESFFTDQEWYYQNETADSWPAEERGTVQATLKTDYRDFEECQPQQTMIVVLVTYPGSGDPTDDPFNGENIVIIEKGKKQFHKTKLAEVKTPQLRWAGEKIALEKDWSDVIDPDGEYIAVYHLEQQSIGELHEAGIRGNPDGEIDGSDIVVSVNGDHPVSTVIFQSEVQGEADINATLYWAKEGPNSGSEIRIDGQIWSPLWGKPTAEIGFLVYNMAFEDVVLAEDIPLDLASQAGEQIDITPWAPLQNLDPILDDADIAVQVRGWFTSDELPGTSRPAVDLNGDMVYDLPAGRYVMPNDWPALANYYYEFRPNMDMMDQAHMDDIVSDFELGPYDGGVVSAGISGEAEDPVIGPFNTTQQWNVEDLWISEAMVVADVTVAPDDDVWDEDDLRNTVVPDGMLDWLDAPMPQALVVFQMESYSTAEGEIPTFSELDKGDLEGYGIQNDEFQSPYYAVEVPSHWAIPSGYNWNSWGFIPSPPWFNEDEAEGPYDFWTDMEIDSIISDTDEDPVDTMDAEVYSDNHGIAGVTIDALLQAGSVTFIAKAEYPYSPKKGKYGPVPSDDITVVWGAIELNPHFLADKTEVDANEVVTFTNETAGGTHPYTKAQWDFDADGTPEIVKTGTEAQVMESVTYDYDADGVYTVRLTMTDSTPTTRHEDRIDYITVGTDRAKVWNMPIGGEALIAPNPGAGRPFLTIDADCADIEVSAGAEIWGIFYLDETVPGGEWLFYIPGFSTNTLSQIETDQYYYVVVSHDNTTLTIPQGP
ncbi:PKD domain-containing protein [Chloroflexota bacterium]